MSPATIRFDAHANSGSGHLVLAMTGATNRTERMAANELAAASPHIHLIGRAWAHREVQPESTGDAFQWFLDVTGQLRLPLDAGTQGYAIRRARRDTELRWLERHSPELRGLAGHWVAISGNELISYGRKPKEVLEAARQRGVDSPLVFYVPGAEAEISFAAFD